MAASNTVPSCSSVLEETGRCEELANLTSDLAADAPTTATPNRLSKIHRPHLTRCEPAERAKGKRQRQGKKARRRRRRPPASGQGANMRWLEPAHPITDHPTPGRTEARRLACQDISSASTRLVLYAVAGGRSHFSAAKQSLDKAIHKQFTVKAQTRDPSRPHLTCSHRHALSLPKASPGRPHASFMGRTAPSVLRPRRRRDGRLHGARQEESEQARNPCPVYQ